MSGIHRKLSPLNNSTDKNSTPSTLVAQPIQQIHPTFDLNDPLPESEVFDLNRPPKDASLEEEQDEIFTEVQGNEDEELVVEWLNNDSDV